MTPVQADYELSMFEPFARRARTEPERDVPALPATWRDVWPLSRPPVPVEQWLGWVRTRTGLDLTHELRRPTRVAQLLLEYFPNAPTGAVRLRDGACVVRVGSFICVLPRYLLE